jgi:Flp pilus assembly protein TadD
MKKIVILIGLLAVVAAGYFSLPAYHNWKQRRFLAQAREYYAKSDLRNAALSARQALTLNPADAEACRIMARITESIHMPVAVDWWQKVVNLDNTVSNRIELARSTLMFGNYQRAGQILQTIAPTNQNTAIFQQLAAMVDVGEDNLAAADWHFAQAVKLDPRNKSMQFDEAVLHLQAKNPEYVNQAKQALQDLTTDPQFRKDALRHLALAAVKNGDFTAAEEFSSKLESDTNATFEDGILQLSILHEAGSHDFDSQLGGMKAEAASKPEHIYTLAAWLGSHGLAADANTWLAQLPDTVQTNMAVCMARADTFMALGDWPGLTAFLQDQNWGDYEFARFAQLARANHEQKLEIVSEANWQDAIQATDHRLKPLVALSRLAGAWHWNNQREDLLWDIVQRYPGERWALQALNQIYMDEGDTRGLQKVFSTLVDFDANDIAARNNLASLDLLLNLDTSDAAQMAHDVYLKHPNISAFAATYAYAQYVQGDIAAGLKTLETLTPQQLEQPGVAVYYGVLLAASGETNKAGKYLDIADTGNLLPEEKELVKIAREAK